MIGSFYFFPLAAGAALFAAAAAAPALGRLAPYFDLD
jgi:hypothetical protein